MYGFKEEPFYSFLCRYTICMGSKRRRPPLLKVYTGFRITLPYEWRNRQGIKVGDFIKCEFDGVKLRLIPVEVQVKEKRLE
jgi:hypothetical protein